MDTTVNYGGLVGSFNKRRMDLDDNVNRLRKEIAGLMNRLQIANKFAIKVMHACSVTLSLLQEPVAGEKLDKDDGFTKLFQFLKEEWTTTFLCERMSGGENF